MRLLNGYRLTAKIKLHSKEKYQACHPSYGFIATGGIICRDRLANEVVKHPKLLWKIETKHSTLKDKPLEFFEKRKCEQRRKKKQLLRAKTFTNVSALKTHSYSRTALLKQRRPSTITEELVLSAPKDILWASDTASCKHEWRGLWKNAKLAKKEPERMRRGKWSVTRTNKTIPSSGLTWGSTVMTMCFLDFFWAVYVGNLSGTSISSYTTYWCMMKAGLHQAQVGQRQLETTHCISVASTASVKATHDVMCSRSGVPFLSGRFLLLTLVTQCQEPAGGWKGKGLRKANWD